MTKTKTATEEAGQATEPAPTVVIGDPRPAGTEGPAGDQRPGGEEGPAGDPRPGGAETLDDSFEAIAARRAAAVDTTHAQLEEDPAVSTAPVAKKTIAGKRAAPKAARTVRRR